MARLEWFVAKGSPLGLRRKPLSPFCLSRLNSRGWSRAGSGRWVFALLLNRRSSVSLRAFAAGGASDSLVPDLMKGLGAA